MTRRRFLLAAAAIVALCLNGLWLVANGRFATEAVPQRLSDGDFWTLATDLSEADGWFRSDNLISNEVWYQSVIPDLERRAAPGGVYLGVGPEQNFTYIAALRPAMAFVVDVRRGNRDLHLMYKALFELSTDRADFVGRLFARPRPAGLTRDSTAGRIFDAYRSVDSDSALYTETLAAIRHHLVVTRHLPLSSEDLDGIEYVYSMFARYGPDLRYSSSAGGFGGASQPTYADLMTSTDDKGFARSYLANEGSYRFVKDLEARNLVVPVVGNFGGAKALRAIGTYLRRRDATIDAFYLSNVEQYLRQDGLWDAFCGNAASLPVDASSMLIRSVREGRDGRPIGGLDSELGTMLDTVKYCM
jgi:hypothetical protein